MQDALSKANRYRQEANRCYELAKRASPGFLRDTYRKVAVQYLFMAEDELKVAEKQDVQNRESVQDREIVQDREGVQDREIAQDREGVPKRDIVRKRVGAPDDPAAGTSENLR